MADKNQKDDQTQQGIPHTQDQAEGELETVEESLKQHEKKDQQKNG